MEMIASNVIPVGTSMASCYLVLGDNPYLVDTNVPKAKAKILQALAAHGLEPEDLRYILITHHHSDHTGNVAELKRLSGAKVAAGREDARVICGEQPLPGPGKISLMGKLMGVLPSSWLERYQKFDKCEVDLELRDGDRLEELGLEVLALPGHTAGGTAFYNRDGDWAFVGDMVSNIMRPGPPFLSFSQDKKEILDSIQRLAELDLDYAFPGHGKILGPGAGVKIRELAEKLQRKW
jgi:glyoxylase-like metal-dependent hydrolase (beta-lactamase superfamily II)